MANCVHSKCIHLVTLLVVSMLLLRFLRNTVANRAQKDVLSQPPYYLLKQGADGIL